MAERGSDEDIITTMINDKIDKISDGISGLLGNAPGTERVPPRQELELWNYRDPKVDIWMEHQQAMAKGLDEKDAMDAATLRAYPNRGTLLLHSGSTDEERAAYATRLRRMSEKQASEPDDSRGAISSIQRPQTPELNAGMTQSRSRTESEYD